MKQGIQETFKDLPIKKYGCAFLCLLQYLAPDLENIPVFIDSEGNETSLVDMIPPALLDRKEMFIKDWIGLYNYLVKFLWVQDKPIIDSVEMGCYKKGEIQVCKNMKKDGTTHFTLRKDNEDVFDPLNPKRAAAKQYITHIPYHFYKKEKDG
jgi:hypothetical protein